MHSILTEETEDRGEFILSCRGEEEKNEERLETKN